MEKLKLKIAAASVTAYVGGCIRSHKGVSQRGNTRMKDFQFPRASDFPPGDHPLGDHLQCLNLD